MSAILKLASIASGFGLLGTSAMYTMRNSQQDFARDALALEYTSDDVVKRSVALPKPKRVPANFMAFTIGGYEIKTAA